MGRKHLANVKEIAPDSEVAILRTSRELPTPPSAVALYQHLDEALEFNPDAVIIASPASFHIEQAIAFAGSVHGMLIEKPIAVTSEQACNLKKELKLNNCNAIIGYNLRYWPPLQKLRDIILAQKYGKLIRLEAHVGQHLSTWRIENNPFTSISCRKELGGGAFRELSHEIDYCLWICGLPTKVIARSSHYLPYGDVEDCVDLWMEFPTGAHASIHMDMLDRLKRRSIRAICENGTIELDFINSILLINGTEMTEKLFVPLSETYKTEIKELMQQPQTQLGATCEEAIAVLDVIESAERSLS